jgi:hypothetical protein
MSASCSNLRVAAVDGDRHESLDVITVRLPRTEKDRFRSLAASRGLSEARLGLIAIRTLLDDAPTPDSAVPLVVNPASERITIRLRAGDRQRIRERAAARRMKDAGYLAALVRAHVVANPPLPVAELQQLKAAVAALRIAIADLSTNLQVLARDRGSLDTLWRNLRETRAQVVDLERHFHAYTLAAVIAWEASSA